MNEFVINFNDYYAQVEGVEMKSDIMLPAKHINYEFSVGEVKSLLMNINTRKATISDDYPSWLSRNCEEDICGPVRDITNTMMHRQRYPNIGNQLK